jgi:chromosome segregation ATPase
MTEERRSDYPKINEDLAVIKNELVHIKSRLTESEDSKARHRERLIGLQGYKDNLDDVIEKLDESMNEIRAIVIGKNGSEGLMIRLDRQEHILKEICYKDMVSKKDFDNHTLQDKAFFALLVTINMAIFAKLVWF